MTPILGFSFGPWGTTSLHYSLSAELASAVSGQLLPIDFVAARITLSLSLGVIILCYFMRRDIAPLWIYSADSFWMSGNSVVQVLNIKVSKYD